MGSAKGIYATSPNGYRVSADISWDDDLNVTVNIKSATQGWCVKIRGTSNIKCSGGMNDRTGTFDAAYDGQEFTLQVYDPVEGYYFNDGNPVFTVTNSSGGEDDDDGDDDDDGGGSSGGNSSGINKTESIYLWVYEGEGTKVTLNRIYRDTTWNSWGPTGVLTPYDEQETDGGVYYRYEVWHMDSFTIKVEATSDQYTLDTYNVDGYEVKYGLVNLKHDSGYNGSAGYTDGHAWYVNRDVFSETPYIYASATPAQYDLSINEAEGATVEVTRKSTKHPEASTGRIDEYDAIYYSDVLEIKDKSETGFVVDKLVVSGCTENSDGTYTVNGDVSIDIVTIHVQYSLSIEKSEGANVSVRRDGITLFDGSAIFYGDILDIAIEANEGYDITSRSHEDGSYLVYDDVSVHAVASKKTYRLSIDQGEGTTITVKRNGTVLADGDSIAYGDELTINISANAGYNLEDKSHNNGTFIVTEYVNVYASASKKYYTLNIDQGDGTTIIVKRDGATLHDGAYIEYGDVLSITISANAGYGIDSRSHDNGNYTVTGNVNVYATASRQTFTLSISQGTGTTIVVKRGSTVLNDGAEIAIGDSLTITITANAGYDIVTKSHNDGTYVVNGDIHVYATTSQLTYKLTISQGTGYTILVKRNGVTLSNNETIAYGDVLEIKITASEGYSITSKSHNDGTCTVTDNVNVYATASVLSYSLTISSSDGGRPRVYRTSSPKKGAAIGELSNGDIIYHSDVLRITITVSAGYGIGPLTVNGASFNAGDSHTVTGAVVAAASGYVKSFTLTKKAGTGSSITIKRTSSPKKGATTGTLEDGATIYHSDVLQITCSASTGYNLTTVTVNGASFVSGKTHTVTGNVSVESAADVKAFTLSINAGAGSIITVNRTKSPKKGATTGNLSSGATIYHSDVLKISVKAESSYEVESLFVNGSVFESGKSHTVVDSVTVTTSTGRLGLVYIDDGNSFQACLIFIDNGTSWEQCMPQVDNGAGWDLCS